MMDATLNAEMGRKHLRRLEVFLDVVYALLFIRMIAYLPPAENLSWVDSPIGLLQVFADRPGELARVVIGVGLTVIYWNLNNRLLAPLSRTDSRHAVFALVQMFFVCLFVYFAISDPALKGGPSSPALQALSLAIAGFIGVVGLRYAAKAGLMDDRLTNEDRDRILRSTLIEPCTALINIPVAWIGPLAWTLGWFVIPFGVVWAIKRLKSPVAGKT